MSPKLEQDLAKYKTELARIDEDITKATKVIELAISLANNCYRAFKLANKEEKIILAQAMFEKIMIKDKQIVSATLNEPLNFICQSKIQGNNLFKYATTGGDDPKKIESPKRLPFSVLDPVSEHAESTKSTTEYLNY